MTDMIIKAFSADISVSEGERAVTAYISTTAVDRDSEVMLPQGANLKFFEKNPVVLFQHNSFGLPIGKAAGLTRDDKGIKAKTIFAKRPEDYPADSEWLPDTVLDLFKQGVLKGFSVGFRIQEQRPATDRDVEMFGAGVRRVITKWELLEYSVVTVPANQEALSMAVSKSAARLQTIYKPKTKTIQVRSITTVVMPHDVFTDMRQPKKQAVDFGEVTKLTMLKSMGRIYVD